MWAPLRKLFAPPGVLLVTGLGSNHNLRAKQGSISPQRVCGKLFPTTNTTYFIANPA